MPDRQMSNRAAPACGLLLVLAVVWLPFAAVAQDTGRLQELLHGEALFHSHQRDYLSAISRLQLSEEQGLLPHSSQSTRLLLARMKLAYGMHLEAGFDLHALPSGEVTATTIETNRAWYELARAFTPRVTSRPRWSRSHISGETCLRLSGGTTSYCMPPC